MASEQDGVRCPDGHAARITDANRHLYCSRERVYKLASVCPMVPMVVNGVSVPRPQLLDPNGTDRCTPVGGGPTTYSKMAAMPGDYPPANQFTRAVRATEPDEFRAVGTEFAWPVGGDSIYPYHPRRGLVCLAGWDGDVRYNGRGIRCDQVDEEGSTYSFCDVGWSLMTDHRGNEDRCVGIWEGPTIPAGYTKVTFEAERARGDIGWVLQVRDGSDWWVRKRYRYPVPGAE
jgi:hypothetical protein